MKIVYCLMLLLCPYWNFTYALETTPLNIGDEVPVLRCSNVLNYKDPYIDISRYKGSLVILDFILTTCSSCMENLSRFKELQNSFAGKVQFIVVTGQSTAIVQRFLQKSPAAKQLNFPVITADSQLKKLFPHVYFSHLVWIGPDQKVRAITHGEYVTADNIESVLSGKTNYWPVKKDVPDFDYKQPLLYTGTQLQQNSLLPLFSATLLPYIPEVNSHMLRLPDSGKHEVRWAFFNQPVTELYLRLMGYIRFPYSRIILEVKDDGRYIFNPGRDFRRSWYSQNSYCFESLLPDSMPLAMQQELLRQQFNLYLGINGRIEERLMPCLQLQPAAVQPLSTVAAFNGDSLTVWALLNQLNMEYGGKPVFNSLPGTDTIRLAIDIDGAKKSGLVQQALAAEGLQLLPFMQNTTVLVITEPLFITQPKKLL